MMFKWLVALALFLYAALWFGGEDKGQLRAGLKAAPLDSTAPTITAPPTRTAAVLPAEVKRPTAAELVPMLPRPAVQVMPPPAPMPDQGIAAMTQPDVPAAADSLIQTLLQDDPPATEATLRWVAVERANVRADARKTAPVTGRLDRGEAVAVLWTDANGWARIRIEGDGIDGFIHQSLLTDLNPQFQ